jgi:hypothetical protein
MLTTPPNQIEPVLDASESNEPRNPFAPPQSVLQTKANSGKLLPHQKAGRVIRLMALLGLIGVIGIGAAVLLPAYSTGKTPPIVSLIPILVFLALIIGLFFVGSAVMRHEA